MARVLTQEELSVWEDRISRQARSGLTVAEFCLQEQISAANFHYRRRKLRGAAERDVSANPPIASQADPVECVSPFFQVPVAAPRGGGCWIEIITADGNLIRLPQQNLAALELALTALPGSRG